MLPMQKIMLAISSGDMKYDVRERVVVEVEKLKRELCAW